MSTSAGTSTRCDSGDGRDRERPQEELGLSLGLPRQRAGHRLVHEHAEREEIRASVDLDALDVLGRDVTGRPEHLLRERERGCVDDLGDAEVGELDAVARLRCVEGTVARIEQEHVLGLEVAVDDAGFVRARERGADLLGDADDAVPPHRSPLEHLEERLRRRVFHHEVRGALELAEVGDLDDVRMVDAVDRARLAEEALALVGVEAEITPEDLDGVQPVDHHVAREVDDGHAARAELLHEAVARRDRPAEHRIGRRLELGAVERAEARVVRVKLGASWTELHDERSITQAQGRRTVRRSGAPKSAARAPRTRRACARPTRSGPASRGPVPAHRGGCARYRRPQGRLRPG